MGCDGETNGNSSVEELRAACVGIVDRALGAMGASIETAPKQDAEQCRCEDPVQTGRCSSGRSSFVLLTVVCVSAGVFDWRTGHFWGTVDTFFVAMLALYVAAFLGGDVFMFAAFRDTVNKIQKQIRHQAQENDVYEVELAKLSSVEKGLTQVQDQLGGDLQATVELLVDMDKFSKLQIISTVMHSFFAADYDGSGHITGQEAEALLPQLHILWDLAPTFDQSRLLAHVKANGLTLAEFCELLDALVTEDQQKCLAALELVITSSRTGDGKPLGLPPSSHTITIEEESAPRSMGMYGSAVVGKSMLPASKYPNAFGSDDSDPLLVPGSVGGIVLVPNLRTADVSEEVEVLQPMCTLPAPSCTIGPFIVGGGMPIWSIMHMVFVIATFVATVLAIKIFADFDVENIAIAIIGVCLSFGLAGAGRLIEVLRVLRQQVKELRRENERLTGHVAALEKRVRRLRQLQIGFDELQQICAGNVKEARELIDKRHTLIKMQAMSVVIHLFRLADRDQNMKIDEGEVVTCMDNLELVFGCTPGFDRSALQTELLETGLTSKEMTKIVDLVFSFGDIADDTPAAGEG